jgi:dephospho-CoA kinase
MNDTKIIGIGGLPRSGKDTLADEFIKQGYYGFSFGDYAREYTRKRHTDKPDPISRANMTETSNWLRETYGSDVILKAALREFEDKQAAGEQYKGMVLYSVRASIEVDWILAHGGELIWVTADDAVRHARSLKHIREGELPTTLEEFKAQEDEQWKPQPGIPQEVQMNVSYVKDHATHILENDADDLDTFLKKAHDLISTL